MVLTNNKDAVLYARLSVEDGIDDKSCSIHNQIELLSEYANKNDYNIIDIIYDDGYSGTNFNRPGFNKMITLINKKKINVIIVKDLSRFGRDFNKCSYYIDDFFKDNDIRLISISDNFDSVNEDEIVIKNYINSLYAKECRKKVVSAVIHKAKNERLSKNGVYGYKIENNKLVVDENVSYIIKRIFNEYIKGKKTSLIASNLNQDGIMTPGEYRKKAFKMKNKLKWNSMTINNIIRTREYCGDVVNLKKIKVNKRVVTNRSPIILENQHEAIIEKDIFLKAQKKINRYKNVNKNELILSILYTKDNKKIGYNLNYYYPNEFLKGSYYNKLEHLSIRVEIIHEVLKKHCYRMLKKRLINNNEFKKHLIKKCKNLEVENEIIELKNKEIKLNNYFEKTFERYALEKIDVIQYNKEKNKIKEELEEIKKKIEELEKESINDSLIRKIEAFYKKIINENFIMLDTELIKFCIRKVEIVKINKGKFLLKILDIFNINNRKMYIL